MNHTVAYKIYTTPTIQSNDQSPESFSGKIGSWLNTILRSRRSKKSIWFQHKTFMDANLLDDVMGTEISRTLRR